MSSFDWINQIVEKIILNKNKSDTIICASSSSPSGVMHLGIMRDIIITHSVVLELSKRGYSVKHIHFWDDYDLSKESDIMMPISDVLYKDTKKTIANYHITELKKALNKLKIRPTYIYQSILYKQKFYQKEIELVIKKKEILYNIYKTCNKKNSINKQNFFPFNIYCSKCLSGNVQIIKYNKLNQKVSYICNTCGSNEIQKISTIHGKLPWKIEWAVRWKKFNIHFEPAAENHFTKGGALDISRLIFEKIYKSNIPIIQKYSFVFYKNIKISKQHKPLIPINVLNYIEPKILIYWYQKTKPHKILHFNFNESISTYYDNNISNLRNSHIKFETLCILIQLVNNDYDKSLILISKIFNKSINNIEKEIGTIIRCAIYWVKYIMQEEKKLYINSKFQSNIYTNLDEETKCSLISFLHLLNLYNNFEIIEKKLHISIKTIALKYNISYKDLQRKLYTAIYLLIFNKKTGPKLATLYLALGKIKIINLLLLKE